MRSILLAPLHGVTARTFRTCLFRHYEGFSSAIAPFILATPASATRSSHYKDLIPPERDGPAVVPQLLGNDGPSFIASARTLREAGYSEVNWNLGCPYPMVANKLRGSGLLPFPDRIDAMLETVFADELFRSGSMALSVKTRLGRKSAGELGPVMEALNRYPVKSVTIHPRVGTQMYRGSVDLDAFERALASCTHEVIYNGDITDERTLLDLERRFPSVRAWMVGRAAVRDPSLAERLASVTGGAGVIGGLAGGPGATASRQARFEAFHRDMYKSYRAILSGWSHTLDKMKELWGYWAHDAKDRAAIIKSISRAQSFADYERAVDLALSRGFPR